MLDFELSFCQHYIYFVPFIFLPDIRSENID